MNAKQRRLYAGVEAAELGHGGDRKMAEFLGLDVHPVARGRRELLEALIPSAHRASCGARQPTPATAKV